MSLLARLEPTPRTGDRRSSKRRKLSLQAEGSLASTAGTQVVVHDLSEEGMLVESSDPLKEGERLDLVIPQAGETSARVVWSSGRFFGCRFETPLSTAAVSAALLQSPAAPTLTTVQAEKESALHVAMIELKALAREIERITDSVDSAILKLHRRSGRE